MNRAALVSLLCAPLIAFAQQGAIVTVLQGAVTVEQDAPVPRPAAVLIKLRAGDKLQLARDATVQLVYFGNGRQETWRGAARLEIGTGESTASGGTPEPEIKQLPQMLVRQLVKTPTADNSGRIGAVRLRSIVAPDAVEKLEKNYAELRTQAEAADRTPELYLLAGLFELKRYEQIEALLGEWEREAPGDASVAAMQQHYREAMREAGK